MVRSTLVAAAALAALLGPSPLGAEPPPPDPGQLEHLSDPPGVPAVPTPDSPPQLPIRDGTYVHRQVNVADDGTNIPGDAANEPSIAVDPTHPNHMAIGWRQFDTVESSFREAGWAYTRDGGRTWTFPGSVDEGVFHSDPVLRSDADGTFYYLGLSMTRPPDPITHTCHLFRSTDGGMTWGPPVFAYGGDKEWMAVDGSDGPGRGHIYSSWNPWVSDYPDGFFIRSVDGGASFESPIPMPEIPLFGSMVVDDEGTLHVAGVLGGSVGDMFVYLRSDDAKYAGTTPTFTAVPFGLGGAFLHGATYDPSPNPGGYVGQVWIDVDTSGGPRDGNLYVLCSIDPDDFPGVPSDPMDVYFVRSEDGGATWSTPVRVNDDFIGTDRWQWFGTMDVAPNGRIDAVWNDTRDTGDPTWSELYYSSSMDGGATWSPNERISGAWNSHLGWPNQDKIGDYYDIASDRVGVHVAWAATFHGEQDVWYTRIGDWDCNDNGNGDAADIATGASPDVNGNGIPDECEDSPVDVVGGPAVGPDRLELRCSPNPFRPATRIAYRLAAAGRAVMTVYDPAGRRVATLLDGDLPAGPGEAEWRPEGAASGVFFVRLEAGGAVRTEKVVRLRE